MQISYCRNLYNLCPKNFGRVKALTNIMSDFRFRKSFSFSFLFISKTKSKQLLIQQMALTLLSLFLTAGSPGLSDSQNIVYDLANGEKKTNCSNFQLFYFNYCYNEASCLGALSRYQIKREETSDRRRHPYLMSKELHEF